MSKFYIDSFNIYRKQLLQVADNIFVKPISKVGQTSQLIQSMVYRGYGNLQDYSFLEYKNTSECPDRLFYTQMINPHLLPKGSKVVVLYRDPLERLISAWKTKPLGYVGTFEEFVKDVAKCFEILPIEHIDQHINLQTNHFSPDYVTDYMELKDYKAFCEQNNIPYIELNKNPNKDYQKIEISEDIKSLVKEIYAKDYQFINSIKNK